MMRNNYSGREILPRLEKIAAMRLFGDGDWPADGETALALNKALEDMGLQEPWTSLNRQFNVDLQMVFMGLLETWDMIIILEDYGLIQEDEVDILYDLCGAEKYSELRTSYFPAQNW